MVKLSLTVPVAIGGNVYKPVRNLFTDDFKIEKCTLKAYIVDNLTIQARVISPTHKIQYYDISEIYDSPEAAEAAIPTLRKKYLG